MTGSYSAFDDREWSWHGAQRLSPLRYAERSPMLTAQLHHNAKQLSIFIFVSGPLFCEQRIAPHLPKKPPTSPNDCFRQLAVSGANNRAPGASKRRKRSGVPTGMRSSYELGGELQVPRARRVSHLPSDGNATSGH